MKREELLEKICEICEEIAEEKGYTQYSEYDADCGIWDKCEPPMTSMLEKKFGKLKEFKFHNGNPDNEYIGMRYRFSNPCLHMEYMGSDGLGTMASLEFSDFCVKDGEYAHNGEYRFYEFLCFHGGESVRLGMMLMDKCREKRIQVD